MNKRKRINNLANLKENSSNVQHNLIFPLHFQGNLNVRLPELVERWSNTQQVLDFKVYWARTFGTFEKKRVSPNHPLSRKVQWWTFAFCSAMRDNFLV